MRAVVIDDDALNIELIENFCSRYTPYVQIVGRAEYVDDGIAVLIRERPDVVFLDVEIHGQTGFDILEAIHQNDLLVIIISAYENYAIRAIKSKVVGYILKPVLIADFVRVVEDCKLITDSRRNSLSEPKESYELKNLGLVNKDHIELIPLDQILHLEAKGSYTLITTMDNQQHISSKSLGEHEAKLASVSGFIRVHKSHLVNAKGVVRLSRTKNGSLFLLNEVEVPISSHLKKMVYDYFMN